MTEKKTYVQPKGNAGTLRFVAIALWLLGIACEVLGVLTILNKIIFSNPVLFICLFLVADLILIAIGSYCWKRANKIDPPSEKNKTEFFIKTQLGAIISVIAFFPILLFLINDKNLDKKSKMWVSILAGACLLGSVALGIDYDPISLEDLQQMMVNSESSDFGAGTVQWSKNSKVYHTWEDCSSLKRILPQNLREGSAEAAFQEGKARMCWFCADHFHIVDGVESKQPSE